MIRMAFQPGLSITRREVDILKTIGFTWLAWDSIQKTRELRERKKTRPPPFYLLRALTHNLCAAASIFTVIRSIWHLMSLS